MKHTMKHIIKNIGISSILIAIILGSSICITAVINHPIPYPSDARNTHTQIKATHVNVEKHMINLNENKPSVSYDEKIRIYNTFKLSIVFTTILVTLVIITYIKTYHENTEI